VTASLFITIWRPFHLGETIEILPEGLRGRVTDRNLMFTVVHEGEGRHLHIPNNFFFQKIFRVGEGQELATAGHVERIEESAAAERRAA
jgi:small-conductance mechanosensitive channel